MVTAILSALAKGLWEVLLGYIGSLWSSLAIYRRGEAAQIAADNREDLKDATEASKIAAGVGSLSDQQLDERLRDEQDRRRRMFLDEAG